MNIKPIINNMMNTAANSKFIRKIIPERAGDMAATVAITPPPPPPPPPCIYYTKQSLENEKIPEHNRKFVSGLDLANGIMNVSTQLLLGNFVKDNADKVYRFMFGKHIPADPIMR